MPVTETLSKSELDFSTVYGCLFSLSTTTDYLFMVKKIMESRGANYIANKTTQAETACQVVYKSLEREITKRMNDEQKVIALAAIEEHKTIVYDFFTMDSGDQKRVRGLLTKIKKERAIREEHTLV